MIWEVRKSRGVSEMNFAGPFFGAKFRF